MDTIMEIVKNLDWTPLFISFKTGIVATVNFLFSGFICGTESRCVQEKRAKAIAVDFLTFADGAATDGCRIFSFCCCFSKRRPIGMFLFDHFGIKVVQTWLMRDCSHCDCLSADVSKCQSGL